MASGHSDPRGIICFHVLCTKSVYSQNYWKYDEKLSRSSEWISCYFHLFPVSELSYGSLVFGDVRYAFDVMKHRIHHLFRRQWMRQRNRIATNFKYIIIIYILKRGLGNKLLISDSQDCVQCSLMSISLAR